jgi:single-stranded DNA-specific DHH superfamily exonuclease
MSSKNVKIKSITLLARQETRPPLGVLSASNRDMGFASVFLRIENSSEQNTKLIIQKIEILNTSDRKVQKFSQQEQEIHLHPLENSENAFHLTNKTGYVGQDKVKAAITYKVGSQVYVIESDPVNVKRH